LRTTFVVAERVLSLKAAVVEEEQAGAGQQRVERVIWAAG